MFQPFTRRFVDWRKRRLAIARLRRLDDRLLVDMGTSRDDIACFVSAEAGTRP